jgi:predicted nucleic acid-binding protein
VGRRYRRSHSGIDGIDYLIAATADLLDGSLLTRNIRHLPMFPGLPATRPAPASCE